jgi:hypothetical protein
VPLASVDRYLASLPGGLDAYPECQHRGEPLWVWLQRSPRAGLAEQVPAPTAVLLGPGHAIPGWVPEVHANVLYLAVREACFADDEAFLAHAYGRNRAVLETPTNRVLFWAASPKAILRAAGLRWSSLHRGSAIEVRIVGDASAHVTLTYPPKLFPEIILRGTATGFTVALENAGARDVTLGVREVGETSAVFEGSWK